MRSVLNVWRKCNSNQKLYNCSRNWQSNNIKVLVFLNHGKVIRLQHSRSTLSTADIDKTIEGKKMIDGRKIKEKKKIKEPNVCIYLSIDNLNNAVIG